MNCKQGDLAMVVRSNVGNEGRIVRCIKLIPAWTVTPTHVLEADAWEVDVVVNANSAHPLWIADEFQRPIRPSDGQDETISWAGKPQGVAA